MSFATPHSVPLGQRINVEQKNKKNMKKTYITPSMETVKIATQQMLAGSNPSVSIGSGSVDAGGVESRGWDDWDED
jgi:hypothetical protein